MTILKSVFVSSSIDCSTLLFLAQYRFFWEAGQLQQHVHTASQIVLPHTTDYCRPCQTNVLSSSVSFSMIAKQFLLSAAKDQKALTSSKLQFIDATVKSELFVHEGNYPDTDSGSFTCSSAIILFHYVTGLATILFKFHLFTAQVCVTGQCMVFKNFTLKCLNTLTREDEG